MEQEKRGRSEEASQDDKVKGGVLGNKRSRITSGGGFQDQAGASSSSSTQDTTSMPATSENSSSKRKTEQEVEAMLSQMLDGEKGNA